MNVPAKILVVDDELGLREMLEFELGERGYRVATASNGEEALEKIRAEKFQLVISDIRMPRMGGMEMLDAIKKTDPGVEVIMSTGFGTIETAVSAMKKGAYDFIQKPFNLDEILALVEKALEKNELKVVLGMYETSKAVMASLKLEELLPLLARLSAQVLRADEASIMLPVPDGSLCVVAAATADGEKLERGAACVALGERVAGVVARTGEPVIINGPLEKDPRFAGIEGHYGIKSSIVYPLFLEGALLGVLSVNRVGRDEPFTEADLRHATIFCSQISQALHNAALYRKLEDRIIDIQEMQAQLVQSEKLAAIGQLSAGVAHEINNPLAGITGFAEILLKTGGLNPRQREDVETILKQARRCGDIVKNLLQFSRSRKSKAVPVDLPAAVDAVLRLAAFELKRGGIMVEKSFPAGLPAVQGDTPQLEQVFLNLVMNARQAMEGKGSGTLRVSAAAESGKVVLRFEDTGGGIPPENLDRIFDPFFTTKPAGKGTGLGLSVSYGIVREHKGTIRAENGRGGGAVFIVELPVGGEGL